MVRCPECHKTFDESSAHVCHGHSATKPADLATGLLVVASMIRKLTGAGPFMVSGYVFRAEHAGFLEAAAGFLEGDPAPEEHVEKHALAEELRRVGLKLRTMGKAPDWERDARLVEGAADRIEEHHKTRHEWVNADLLCMEQDLREQAKALADWHDPNGRRRGKLMRARASLLTAFAILSELPTSCGQPSPSGPCRRAQGHQPPWGHQGDAPDAWPTEDPIVTCRNEHCNQPIPHTHNRLEDDVRCERCGGKVEHLLSGWVCDHCGPLHRQPKRSG